MSKKLPKRPQSKARLVMPEGYYPPVPNTSRPHSAEMRGYPKDPTEDFVETKFQRALAGKPSDVKTPSIRIPGQPKPKVLTDIRTGSGSFAEKTKRGRKSKNVAQAPMLPITASARKVLKRKALR